MTSKTRAAEVSPQSLKRMPDYLRCLAALKCEGVVMVSAPTLAKQLQLNEVQVRKDLASVGRAKGKPRQGFPVEELYEDLTRFLGYDRSDEAVIVGAGSIGRALIGYRGFDDYGLRIVAAFDVNPLLIGHSIAGRPVYSIDELPDRCRTLNAKIGVITVPASAAQEACDLLVSGGVLAIWNFAPAHLNAPENILIQNENMAASLALLNKHLRMRLEEAYKG